jgi:hypothetical protein
MAKMMDAHAPRSKKSTPSDDIRAVINDREKSQNAPLFVIQKLYAEHIRKYHLIL